LQSGFVLAVVLGAVLFAGRLGGTEEVARRIYQVALAATLAFVVIAGVTAFIRPPSAPAGLISGSSSSSSSSSDGFTGDSSSSSSSSPTDKSTTAYFKDVADHAATARSVRAGVGLLILIGGLAALRRRPTVALGTALGGLLLLLFGGSAASSNGGSDIYSSLLGVYSGLIGSALGTSSRGLDIAHFGVLAGGTVALLLFGLIHWDADAPAVAAPAPVPDA
jgi:hypothetical protein